MTTSPMFLLATISVAAVEPIARMPEVPELASMALLSVVLVGVSMVVRRSAPSPQERGEARLGETPETR